MLYIDYFDIAYYSFVLCNDTREAIKYLKKTKKQKKPKIFSIITAGHPVKPLRKVLPIPCLIE